MSNVNPANPREIIGTKDGKILTLEELAKKSAISKIPVPSSERNLFLKTYYLTIRGIMHVVPSRFYYNESDIPSYFDE